MQVVCEQRPASPDSGGRSEASRQKDMHLANKTSCRDETKSSVHRTTYAVGCARGCRRQHPLVHRSRTKKKTKKMLFVAKRAPTGGSEVGPDVGRRLQSCSDVSRVGGVGAAAGRGRAAWRGMACIGSACACWPTATRETAAECGGKQSGGGRRRRRRKRRRR